MNVEEAIERFGGIRYVTGLWTKRKPAAHLGAMRLRRGSPEVVNYRTACGRPRPHVRERLIPVHVDHVEAMGLPECARCRQAWGKVLRA